MQQTLPHNSRFTAQAKMLVGQGIPAPPMMGGRMMSVGGMTGQSLTSGLEDLKKTADHWLQDQQATHQRNEMMSAKLKQAQEQNQTLTKEKETLMQTIQDLEARIKQDALQTQQCVDKVDIISALQHGLVVKFSDAQGAFQQGEGTFSFLNGAMSQYEEGLTLMEARLEQMEVKWQEADHGLKDAHAKLCSMEAAVQQSVADTSDRDRELQEALAALAAANATNACTEAAKLEAEQQVNTLNAALSTAHASCADVSSRLEVALQQHDKQLSSLQSQHQTAIAELQLQFSEQQQLLKTATDKAEEDKKLITAAEKRIQDQDHHIKALNHQVEALTTAKDNLALELQQATRKLAETSEELNASVAQAEQLARELQEAQKAACAAAEEANGSRQQLEQQLAELQDAQNKMTTDYAAACEELKTLQEQQAALQDRSSAAQEEVLALQSQLAASRAEAANELGQKTQELDSMKNKLLTERAANKRQMEKSAEMMDESVAKAAKLLAEVAELKRQVQSLNAANAQLSSTAVVDKEQAVAEAASAAKREAEQAKLAAEDAQQQQAELQALLQDAVYLLEAERTAKGQMQSELLSLTGTLREKEAALHAFVHSSAQATTGVKAELEQAKAAQQVLQEEVNSLEGLQADLKATLQTAQTNNLVLQEKCSKAEEQAARLLEQQCEIEKLLAKCQVMEEQTAQLQELQACSADLQAKRRECEDLDAQLTELQGQLEDVISKHGITESELVNMKEQLHAAQELNKQLAAAQAAAEQEKQQLVAQLALKDQEVLALAHTRSKDATHAAATLGQQQQEVSRGTKRQGEGSRGRSSRAGAPVSEQPGEDMSDSEHEMHDDVLRATQAATLGAAGATQAATQLDMSDEDHEQPMPTQPTKHSTAAKQQRGKRQQHAPGAAVTAAECASKQRLPPGTGPAVQPAAAEERAAAITYDTFKTPHPATETEPHAKKAPVTNTTTTGVAGGAKKRPRVAPAASGYYADLVSNMTSQGGGEDTDSDAEDDSNKAHVAPRSRNTSADNIKAAGNIKATGKPATKPLSTAQGNAAAYTSDKAPPTCVAATGLASSRQPTAGITATHAVASARKRTAAALGSQAVGGSNAAPTTSKGGRLAAMATSSRLTHGMHRGDTGGEVSSGSRPQGTAAAAANSKRRRPSGVAAGAVSRSRMAPPAPKFTQDPLASQGVSKKADAAGGAAQDLFGFI